MSFIDASGSDIEMLSDNISDINIYSDSLKKSSGGLKTFSEYDPKIPTENDSLSYKSQQTSEPVAANSSSPPSPTKGEPEPNDENTDNKFSEYENDTLAPTMNDVEGIKMTNKQVGNRTYYVYTSSHESLELVRFTIGKNEFISVNSNVMNLKDFMNITFIENIVNSEEKICELRSYNNYQVRLLCGLREIKLSNCSVKLLIRALSEISPSSVEETVYERLGNFTSSILRRVFGI
jgi:hypothetical protein